MSFSGRSGRPGATTVCVSGSDLVLCHTELQACLEAKFSLEGHETQRGEAASPLHRANTFQFPTRSEASHSLLIPASFSHKWLCSLLQTHTHTHAHTSTATPAWCVSVACPSLSSPSLLCSFSSFMFSSPPLHPSAFSDTMLWQGHVHSLVIHHLYSGVCGGRGSGCPKLLHKLGECQISVCPFAMFLCVWGVFFCVCLVTLPGRFLNPLMLTCHPLQHVVKCSHFSECTSSYLFQSNYTSKTHTHTHTTFYSCAIGAPGQIAGWSLSFSAFQYLETDHFNS